MAANVAVERKTLFQRLLSSAPEDINKHYKVIKTIGSGAQGDVEKVQNLKTGAISAMKTLQFRADEKLNKNLKREISIIAKLRCHVNIVRLLHVVHGLNDKLHMVMELCDEDLVRYMKTDGSRSEFSRLSVALQVAKGIDVLHTHDPQIIHRDIKPENILIVRGDEAGDVVVKLADFGISTSDIDLSSTNTIGAPILLTKGPSGTWPYMPPECYAALDMIGLKDGKFCFDASLDIFAHGLVYLYIFCYDDSRYGEIQ